MAGTAQAPGPCHNTNGGANVIQLLVAAGPSRLFGFQGTLGSLQFLKRLAFDPRVIELEHLQRLLQFAREDAPETKLDKLKALLPKSN